MTDPHVLKTPETLLKTILIVKVVPCTISNDIQFISNDRHADFENARDIVENYINSEGRSLYYYNHGHTHKCCKRQRHR